ncbi:MAG: hypothetical protein H6Q43_3746 [Deltaproteobacteria bacterium]|nr:hypothetical protein [Deltaproteobacteria bacterium]
MENKSIADIFTEIADILDIQDENPFRIRSYRNAARTIDDMSESLQDLVKAGRNLEKIPGIGKSIHEKIMEILNTGKCQSLEDLRKKIPPGLTELLRLEGLGPKKVKLLYDELGVDSVDRLEKAAQVGRLRVLAGMGEKTEEKILKSIEQFPDDSCKRFPESSAWTRPAPSDGGARPSGTWISWRFARRPRKSWIGL